MAVQHELEGKGYEDDQYLHSNQQPYLKDPVLKENAMNQSLQKWPDSVGNRHQNI